MKKYAVTEEELRQADPCPPGGWYVDGECDSDCAAHWDRWKKNHEIKESDCESCQFDHYDE